MSVNELKDNSMRRINIVAGSAIFTGYFVYTTIALGAFYTYGDLLKSDILRYVCMYMWVNVFLADLDTSVYCLFFP